MELLPIAFLAGVLTVLSPCVLPLLPVVLAGSAAQPGKRSAFLITGSLAVSVVLFTLLIKATTVLLGIPSGAWLVVSGVLVAVVGASLLFPASWEWFASRTRFHEAAARFTHSSGRRSGAGRNILLGMSLGPAFASCSPTYGLILAVVLPASLASGVANIASYTLGLGAVMLLAALGGQKVTRRLGWALDPGGKFRRGLGAVLVIVGLLIASGQMRKVEAWLIDNGILGAVVLEQDLLESVREQPPGASGSSEGGVQIPTFLRQSFPATDWSRADPAIAGALDGGPAKDGIPALEDPSFVPISSFRHPDSVQALVIEGRTEVKAYPYNILVWHEIVNDTVDGVPIAVTFCPLCGSAVVFERVLPGGEESTFGVSGGLLESNMIMYDRKTETLWQQSTGKALAGTHFGHQLPLHKFQLMTVGEMKAQFPDALIQGENTGHMRDYSSNPYSGYEESEGFYFAPSVTDKRYPSKEIFVAFTVEGTPVAVPWLALENGDEYATEVDGTEITLTKADNKLRITGADGADIPFYFEMWFSWAVQNKDAGTVFDPRGQ